MTFTSTGSSLSQAHDSTRDTSLDTHLSTSSPSKHPHEVAHARYRNRFRHARRHHIAHQNPHQGRQADTGAGSETSPSFVTRIVQTVSLVHVVDTDGHPLETQTRYASPATLVLNPDTGATVAIPRTEASSTNAVPGSNPANSVDGPLAPTSRPSGSMSSQAFHSLSSSAMTQSPHHSGATPHSSSGTPSGSTAPSYPKLSAAHNATNPHGTGNLTVMGGTSNSLMFSTPASLTSTHETETVFTSHTLTSSRKSHSTTLSPTSTSSHHASSTVTGGDFGEGANSQPTTTEGASGSSGDDGPGLSQQQKGIVGGVVGGVAGAAFFLLLVMLALRYKRRRANRAALDEGPAGMIGGGQSGGGPSMTERSVPPGITAAVASLTGKRKSRIPPETTGERGFYRVSGRKLPSVLQAGGDGYTDPRISVMSGETDYYRGSQAFEPVSGGSTRLALGTPMRPVSGIPIMRTGPGRTAVQEANPFADPAAPSPPLSPTDPHDRMVSGDSGDGRGPASRFQEGI